MSGQSAAMVSRAAAEMAPENAELDASVLTERRDVKVKLPAALVLRLYYLKLTTSLNYSDVVEEALNRYFAEADREAAAAAAL